MAHSWHVRSAHIQPVRNLDSSKPLLSPRIPGRCGRASHSKMRVISLGCPADMDIQPVGLQFFSSALGESRVWGVFMDKCI